MAKIMIVDDQNGMLILVNKILTQEGHTVVKANNAFDALDMLETGDFDLLITDIVMPGRTGYDLTSAVRRSEKLKDLPVIMLTGKNQKRDVEKGIRAGTTDYVLKPVVPQVLVDKVKKLLNSKAQKDTAAA